MVNINIKNEAKSIVSEYAEVFSELERLELMANQLNLEKDKLLTRLEDLRDRELRLIDNIGTDSNNITIEELLA
jgi:predicted nuclease with TOPRIM domain